MTINKPEKPLTEERLREIIQEEIAKIPPTHLPFPYPQPPAPPYQQGHWCPFCYRYNCGQTHITCSYKNTMPGWPKDWEKQYDH